ncbi:MAG: FKBP-type peptidyl-prolyl cis-trans isomerase [Daejeonella sp.]
MTQFFKYAVSGFLLLSIFVACEKEYETVEVLDDRNLTAYIQQNKLNVTEYDNTGIYYEVITPGTGPDVEYSEQLPLIFTTRSLDGKFVSADTFSVNNRDYRFLGYVNPEGLRIGIKEVLKKKSGSLRMLIPSRLAFGRNGVGDIPGNASLDITVNVLDKNKIAGYDDFSIKKYLAANGLTGFTKTASGLYYKIAEIGTGSPITIDSTVVAEYTGKFLNGTVFDKTISGSGATFDLNGDSRTNPQPIKGWQEAIPLIKQGGSIRIIIPSSLGYGLTGDPDRGLPAFTSLDFEIKVTDVTP